MRKILTFLLLSGIVYLSSCGNGGNDKLPIIPQPDSTSKGDSMQFNYTTDATVKNYLIVDYTKSNVAIYAMFASIVYNATDSLWHLKMQLTDNKMQQMGLFLNLTGPTQVGTYTVVDNASTFTDYTTGDFIAYSVTLGSTVNITQASYPIRGTMTLGLYHNHKTFFGNGTFKIFY